MRNEAIYTEEYKGLTINIFPDLDARNPWKDWDGNPPIAVYSDRSITEYGEEYGNANECPELTREQIKKNLPAILAILDVRSVWALRDSFGVSIVDLVNDRLSEYVDDQTDSDRLAALADIWTMADCVAVVKSVHGSCQGDYAEVLAVSTPKFEQMIGTQWTEKELKQSIQLFEDWAFGNVYGYVVEDQTGEHIDSCWGFFGDYDAEYSALSQAKENADYHVEQERKSRIEQIKVWIKNRVPYQYRHFAI